MLNEPSRKQLEGLLVDVVLELRREYLRTPQANILKHWDLLRSRLRIAAKTSGDLQEMWCQLRRRLCLPSPSVSSSRSFEALASQVAELAEMGADRAVREIAERRTDAVMASARLAAEKAKEEAELKNSAA